MHVVDVHTVKKEVASGDFECPVCGGTRPYRHLRARRVARAYGIPVLPVGRPADSLECRTCDATFEAWVLQERPCGPGRVAAVYERGMLHVMAATALAGGTALDASRERILEVFAALSGGRLEGDQLDAALQVVGRSQHRIWPYLHDLEPRLNDVGKERVVHAALFVAAADGRLERWGVRHVLKVARALGVRPRRLKGMVAALPV